MPVSGTNWHSQTWQYRLPLLSTRTEIAFVNTNYRHNITLKQPEICWSQFALPRHTKSCIVPSSLEESARKGKWH